jgi:histidinol-phosphate/aromatic aminotransferase/cobyric acid decarboxylase-like protein
MSKYWNSLTHRIEPYTPGEQPKDKQYIKLNTNENPYPPSPKVTAAISTALNGDLRLYPDPNANELGRFCWSSANNRLSERTQKRTERRSANATPLIS